jgi:hypothetical protein
MAIEIVDLPTKNGDFQQQTVSLPEGIRVFWMLGTANPMVQLHPPFLDGPMPCFKGVENSSLVGMGSGDVGPVVKLGQPFPLQQLLYHLLGE